MTGGPQISSDILGKIFFHLCSDGPLPLRHLLFVSKMFFNAAISNAQLWTTVSFDDGFNAHFMRRPVEHAKGFIEQCLLHSGELPLCLRITHQIKVATLSGPLETFMNPKYKGAEKCASLILSGIVGSYFILNIWDLFPKGLPSLQHMSLSHIVDPVGGSQFPNCPSLERVEMLNHGTPVPPFWGTNFAHITTLSFGNINGWANYDISTLSLFPLLRDLTLFTVEGDGWVSIRTGFPLPVQFQHLQILRVRGPIPSKVLTKLVAPALEKLHIQENVGDWEPIEALSSSLEPLCLHLHALLSESISRRNPMWATPFSKLVQKCTRLEALYVSKWMEEECKKFTDPSNVVLHVL
jgi:hypothetical protein